LSRKESELQQKETELQATQKELGEACERTEIAEAILGLEKTAFVEKKAGPSRATWTRHCVGPVALHLSFDDD